MDLVKTAKLKILSHTKTLEPTITIYNKALSFYIAVVQKEWDNIKDLDSRLRLRYLESVTHATKQHPSVKYDFDKEFYKFPSYLRRACIMEAVGCYSSYNANYKRWLTEKEEAMQKNKSFHKKPPKLNIEPHSFPVFYRKEMFINFFKHQDNQDNDQIPKKAKAKIKAYIDNDWKWLEVEFSAKNLYFSKKHYRFLNFKEHNPTLVRKGKKYFLHMPYITNIELNSVPLDSQTVVGVDLGLTKSAVASAVTSDGTVIGRKFIDQPIEKDRLRIALNRLSKAKRLSGLIIAPNYWRRANGLQKAIAQKTVDEIVKFALNHNATTIVFERLGRFKSPKGFYGAKRLRAKLQYWAKKKIQTLAVQKAHSAGLRVSFVNPKGTSQYAFDGSGEVKRNGKRDLCKFPNGKTYHADLNASYNIGARYFINSFLKPLSEMARLRVEVKVPLLAGRASHTLSSLIRLSKALRELPLEA